MSELLAAQQGHPSQSNGRPHPVPLRDHNFVSDEGIDSPWARRTVISFDGGGVRGYSSLLILKRLMDEIKKVELELNPNATSSCFYEWRGDETQEGHPPPDTTGVYLPCHYFDYMAGTSTGGLTSIMLGRFRLSVDEAMDHYTRFGNEVFGKARLWHERSILWYPRAKYPSRKVRRAYQQIIYDCLTKEKPGITVNQAVREPFKYREDRTRTMVFSFLIDKKEGISSPYLWRTYDNPYGTMHLNPSEAHTDAIWIVARATSAAPRFFESIKVGDGKKHLDGGMCANNPSLKAFREVRSIHSKVPALFISIGTGKKSSSRAAATPPRRAGSRDFDRASKADDERRKQFLKKYREIGNYWKDFMTDTEGDEGYQGWKDIADSHNMPHERFNVEGDMARIPLDDWRPIGSGETTLEKMRVATERYLAQPDVVQRIEEKARLLVEIRRERAKTERWEPFATDVTYVCPSSHDCGALPRYSNRRDFRAHVKNAAFHAELRNDRDALEQFLNTGRRYGNDIGNDHSGNISRVGTT